MDFDESYSANLVAAESLSCRICRRRKVRCDKKYPCNNCQKSKLECVFPRGRRRPTQGRSSRDSELIQRLKHLESAVLALKTSVVHKNNDELTKPPSPATSETVPHGQDEAPPDSGSPEGSLNFNAIADDIGRLNFRNGRSRYTSNALWASLSYEISDMRELLDEDSSEDDSAFSPSLRMPTTSWPPQSGLLLGLMPIESNLHILHPPKAQMLTLWSVFEHNVLPVVSIFHQATTKTLFEKAATGEECISPAIEPVLFSIYYASVVSLNDELCQSLLQESKSRLAQKYRHALEQSLCRADFLNSSTLIVLQAFVLFAICIRRHDDTRLIVSWCATAVRIAMSLGLHRDGSQFGLDPFQSELRRRVWWHLVLLDGDSSRDHGIDPLLLEWSFDTRMPLNINNNDIYPDMQNTPTERQGFTEMTNCIARFEISMVARRLSYNPPRTDSLRAVMPFQTLEDKEKHIRELQSRLDETYLQHCDYSKPLQWATAINVRSACAMLWFTIYHPLQRRSESVSQDMHDRLFASMVEVIENTRLLECNQLTAQWGWYFHNDVQWSAIAYVLNELISRPPGPSVGRAWRVVDAARRQWDADSSSVQRGMLWRAVKTMTVKAGLRGPSQVSADKNPARPGEIPGLILSQEGLDVPPLSLLQGFEEAGVASATLAMQNDLGVVNSQLPEDAWFLMEEDHVASIPKVLPTSDQSNVEPTANSLFGSAWEENLQDPMNPPLYDWWSLVNGPGQSQWPA